MQPHRIMMWKVLDVRLTCRTLLGNSRHVASRAAHTQRSPERPRAQGVFRVRLVHRPIAGGRREGELLSSAIQARQHVGMSLIPRGFTGELPTEIDPDLLQGVPLSVCLSGWGRHWSTNKSSTRSSLSQSTTRLDAFLSHDWGTSTSALHQLGVAVKGPKHSELKKLKSSMSCFVCFRAEAAG